MMLPTLNAQTDTLPRSRAVQAVRTIMLGPAKVHKQASACARATSRRHALPFLMTYFIASAMSCSVEIFSGVTSSSTFCERFYDRP